jgi:hypothetical protein
VAFLALEILMMYIFFIEMHVKYVVVYLFMDGDEPQLLEVILLIRSCHSTTDVSLIPYLMDAVLYGVIYDIRPPKKMPKLLIMIHSQ